MLAENFMRIALYDEYRRGNGGFVREETASRLRRWEVPVRIGVRFGASVPPDRQATDRARIASFAARLSPVTGHPITLDDANPNFLIHVVSEDEREALGPKVRAFLPNLSPGDVAGITNMPRSTYCLVYALADRQLGRLHARLCGDPGRTSRPSAPVLPARGTDPGPWPAERQPARAARRSSTTTRNSPC